MQLCSDDSSAFRRFAGRPVPGIAPYPPGIWRDSFRRVFMLDLSVLIA